jgi:hypothetical protein
MGSRDKGQVLETQSAGDVEADRDPDSQCVLANGDWH